MDISKDTLKRTITQMLMEESKSLYDLSESDTNSEEELFESEILGFMPAKERQGRHRKIWRIQNYLEIVSLYGEATYKSHFRMTRRTIQKIIDSLNGSNYQSLYKAGKPQVNPEKAVLMTVWYMSNTETFRQISDRFDVSFSTAHTTINNVLDVIVGMKDSFIKWPTENSEIQEITTNFQKKQGFSGCIGAIDGCHIKINRPLMNEECYVNRKGYHSLLLQAVALPNKLFSNVYCGEPGSIHDARVLKKSPLYIHTTNNPNYFGNNYLVGDSAYPNLNWLIAPFRDNGNLNRRQKQFNFKHSSTRIVIEHAYGLLKGRFRRLHHINNINIDLCVKIIMAGCVLHNICLTSKDDTIITLYRDVDFPADNNDLDVYETRREQLLTEVCP